MDDVEKLKSIKDPTDWIYEEFSESEPDQYSEIRRRLRVTKVKQTTFTGMLNPVAGWWGREYFMEDPEADQIPLGIVKSSRKGVLIHKSTYHKNPWINKEEQLEKNRELAILDENNWIIYELGDWGQFNKGGEFYHQYKRRLHVKPVEFNTQMVSHISFDFNVLPYMTMLVAQIYKRKEEINGKPKLIWTVKIVKEYCLEAPENTTEACLRHFSHDFGKHRPEVIYYGDAMGNKRHEGTGNKTEFKKVREIIQSMIDDGSDRTWRVNPSVMQTRNFINKILAGVEIVPGVIINLEIDPSCKELIKDMEHCKLAADGGKLKVKVKNKKTGQTFEQFGHASDSLSYLICKAFEDYFKANDS
jgi:hypothetical protein